MAKTEGVQEKLQKVLHNSNRYYAETIRESDAVRESAGGKADGRQRMAATPSVFALIEAEEVPVTVEVPHATVTGRKKELRSGTITRCQLLR